MGQRGLIMQDQLGQIGIKINIVEQEWSAYLSNVLLPGKFNISGYVNPAMDKLLDEGRNVPGCAVADREKIYTQIQQLAHDDVPYDWLVSTTQVNVLNKRAADAYIGQWDGGVIPKGVVGWSLGS